MKCYLLNKMTAYMRSINFCMEMKATGPMLLHEGKMFQYKSTRLINKIIAWCKSQFHEESSACFITYRENAFQKVSRYNMFTEMSRVLKDPTYIREFTGYLSIIHALTKWITFLYKRKWISEIDRHSCCLHACVILLTVSTLLKGNRTMHLTWCHC